MLFLIILILSLLSAYCLPWWWIIAIIAFVASFFFAKNLKHAFWSGFFAVFILWVILALIRSIPNKNILADRVALLFHLPHWIFLTIITGIIGGVVCGLAAMSGFQVRKFKNLFSDQQNT